MVKVPFLILFFTLQAFAQIAVVSDLDDTIKRTNVSNPTRSAYNAIFKQDIFTGMDQLFKSMKPYSELYILSASPSFLGFNIEKLIETHELHPREVFTRGFEDLEDKLKYKYETIDYVSRQDHESLILIGDDVEADPKVYLDYKKEHSDRVLAIYIHKVEGSDLPEGVVGFHTSYELALREVLAGRMGIPEARQVGEAVLGKYMGEAFPDFVVCPTSLEELAQPDVEGLEELSERIGQRIVKFCRNRKKRR